MLSVKRKSDSIEKFLCSPNDELEETLLTLIAHEEKKIVITVFMFTLVSIVDALLDAHVRGVDVCVVVDQSSVIDKSLILRKLYEGGVDDVFFFKKRLMHNKVAIFSQNLYEHSIIWTGSANFTDAGFHKNQENVVVCNSDALVKKYREQSNRIIEGSMAWCEYEGTCRK